jgi:hypothetical protein
MNGTIHGTTRDAELRVARRQTRHAQSPIVHA